MSRDFIADLEEMHGLYGFHEKIKDFDKKKLQKLLEFRHSFLAEEIQEMYLAISTEDEEGVVDALIDLIVVAVGTLDLFEVDSEKAWDAVHAANMSKKTGIKASRPNPLGLPDLIKPEGWVAPSHNGNHGKLAGLWD